MKPRSWMILLLALGTIALAIGIVTNEPEWLTTTFNIPATSFETLREFLRQYIAGIPIPPPIS